MIASARVPAVLAVLALLIFAPQVRADENCEPVAEQVATNTDQSTLSVTTVCDKEGIRSYLMRARTRDGRTDQKAVEHAYRLHGRAGTLGNDDMDFMVEVGADLDSEEENAPARCTFSRSIEGARQVMRPPGRQWLQLCELYGDYHLTTPEEASAAEAAGSAQE